MTESSAKRVAVVGAASQIGRALLPRLEAEGIHVFRIGRENRKDDGATTYVFDEQRECFTPPVDSADAVISLAPLPSIDLVLKMAAALGAKRIIAFGSTGRFSKVGSTSTIEQDFVAQQMRAERVFSSQCETAGIAWTLFRPTMIYGADADLNVAFIKSMIRLFGFFPIPWGARGLRQPVHLDDLAAACVAALQCERTYNQAYNLGGGEVLDFPELVRRIFRAERRRPILLTIPKSLFSLLVKIAARNPRYAFIRQEMVDRMFMDLTTDNEPAQHDFGYKPRAFLPVGSAMADPS